MKGSANVIAALNTLLASELSAMDQYFIHSEMYQDWGLNKLYERISHEFEDEKGHAKLLIGRILFLEGTPDLTTGIPSMWARMYPRCCKAICNWNTTLLPP